jgi:hypothetical protein
MYDLMDMASLSNWNKLANKKGVTEPINFILVIICVFSKYLFAIPFKNKTAHTTSKAISTLLDRIAPRKPGSFQTDKGIYMLLLTMSHRKLVMVNDPFII